MCPPNIFNPVPSPDIESLRLIRGLEVAPRSLRNSSNVRVGGE